MKFLQSIARGILRGTALFLGLFSLANIFVSQFGRSRLEDIWWIDLTFLPAFIASTLALAFAVLMIGFALKPRMSAVRKYATSTIVFTYVAFALYNSLHYYSALSAGDYTPLIAIPFTLIIAALLVMVGLACYYWFDKRDSAVEGVLSTVCFLLCFALFPLSQMVLFGTTNYAKKADAAIVFGARVYRGNVLSQAVRERMDSAIELYEDKTVSTLLLTGGIDADGTDEPAAMKVYAISQGVPSRAVLVDNRGINTDESVANCIDIASRHDIDSALAVSQFFHLPRIKMAFRSGGMNVRTVPAQGELVALYTPKSMVREIPAFWVYWVRGGARDLRSSQGIVGNISDSVTDNLRPFFSFAK